jgi:hypothetical protein
MNELNKRREELIRDIEAVAKLRRGQLSEQYLEKPGADGSLKRYGPYYLWQSSVKGQKRSERVGREHAEQVREELKAYQQYKGLCEELADVTEQITCQAQKTDDAKKKLQEARTALKEELNTFLGIARDRLKSDGLSRLDWLENGLREVLLKSGAKMVSALLNDSSMPVAEDHRRKGEKVIGQQKRTVTTLFGPIDLIRRAYYNADAHCCRYPLDDALQLMEGFTPTTAKLVCRSGAREPYLIASEDLEEYAGIHVDARRIQRLLDRNSRGGKEDNPTDRPRPMKSRWAVSSPSIPGKAKSPSETWSPPLM